MDIGYHHEYGQRIGNGLRERLPFSEGLIVPRRAQAFRNFSVRSFLLYPQLPFKWENPRDNSKQSN